MFLVYLLTCRATGKRYVGQTCKTAERRWREHVQHAAGRSSGCRILADAIRQYGAPCFTFEVLATLDDRAQANVAESFWIETLHTIHPDGLNLQAGGYKGSQCSAESRRKQSESMRAHVATMTPEQRRGMLSAARAALTPEQLSANGRKGIATRTREERAEYGRRMSVGRTREERSEATRKVHASRTPEQRSEIVRKGHASRRLAEGRPDSLHPDSDRGV